MVVPDYLGPRDYPWLRALLDEYHRFEGKTFRELGQRLADEPLWPDGPRLRKVRASVVLDRRCRDRRRQAETKARAIREALFGAAASRPGEPADAIARDVAQSLELDTSELERALFADVASERLVARPDRPLTPMLLALETNTALAKGLLARSVEVAIELAGNAGAIARQAQRFGLICSVKRGAPSRGVEAVVEISGPLALFRRTLIYGRSLAALVPELGRCERFRLVARCVFRDRVAAVEMRSGDPLLWVSEKRRESGLENRFVRDLARATGDWIAVRDPEPIEIAGGLIIPSFTLQHRSDRGRLWFCEIAGFWTREHLERKLAAAGEAGVTNLIVCVDAERNCDEREPPEHGRIVKYRRRIDPAAVLAILEGLTQ